MKNKITQVTILAAFGTVIMVMGCGADRAELDAGTLDGVNYAVSEIEISGGAENEVPEAETVSETEYCPFTYEICEDEGIEYVKITGIKPGYHSFSQYWDENTDEKDMGRIPKFILPDEVNDIPVREIGDRAFQDEYLEIENMHIPEEIERIGESAFENCGLRRVIFEGEMSPVIGKRAFADNPHLWAVCVPKGNCVIAEDAFADCDEVFYLAYGEKPDGEENSVEDYAAEHGMTTAWVFDIDSMEPVVRYPEEPLVLTPEVRNFFYGENADDDNFCSMEYADDAPDYGFDEWHAPCGEFCAGGGFLELEASSELASSDDRYAVKHVCTGYGRKYAWAEGVEGPGIGESITYHDCNQWNITNRWEGLPWERFEQRSYPMDGYIRYTDICIVNGYAKNQKTWEENGRIKRLLMYVEDKPYAYLELEDTIYPQYFSLPWEDIMSVDGGEITFRFVIEDVYPGTLYEDTCLTGLVVEFTGRHGH
ncbi:MAG: leucine-rich repeat domain-containing protein [Lachnospiraceae bacterium]|nr:leucine-rich repeat domain-containing protein [Lachnospiraceae bacterium]